MRPRLIAIATFCRYPEILPHFFAHYLGQGVDEIYIMLRGDDALYDAALATLDRFGRPVREAVHIERACTEHDPHIHKLVEIESRHLAHVATDKDWIMDTDVDEFYDFGQRTARDLLGECQRGGYGYVRGRFLDRMGEGFSQPEIPVWPRSLWAAYPVACDFTRRVMKAATGKVMLRKYPIRVKEGHHNVINTTELKYPEEFTVHHFKWVAGIADFLRIKIDKVNATGEATALKIGETLQRALEFFEDREQMELEELCQMYGLSVPEGREAAATY